MKNDDNCIFNFRCKRQFANRYCLVAEQVHMVENTPIRHNLAALYFRGLDSMFGAKNEGIR